MAVKVWVDPSKCRGHALCLTHAPGAFEFIDLEDRSQAVPGAAATTPIEQLRTAASECPEHAITVEEG